MANITDGSQVEVPSREDKNPDSGRSKSVKRMKRLETMADELKRVKHELAALKKKDICEGEEKEEVNGSEAAANEEVDGIEGDANEEGSEGDENEEEGSEGEINEEEEGSEGDENEEGSEGEINEEDGSEGVQNEEDMNGDRADFDNKHEQTVQEGAGRNEKVTESVTVEGNINGDGGKGETAAADVSTNSEKGKAVMAKEGKDAKNSAKENNMPTKKTKRARRRHKTTTDAAASKEDNKSDELPNASKKEALAAEEVKMVDGMGLIFMCNAKTKQDCFRYKILGLPASKKELVEKIYKGMRLFLFDVDLKLMYGIFKAAAPGGYNIEPQAFKSAYPAQVRFVVLNDCLPLPEEKFKAAIKENYFGRNKFNNQLSSEQVKKLCKIFQTASKNKRPRGDVNAETEPIPPSKRRRRARTDAIRTARPDPRPAQRAAGPIRARPALGPRTSSHGRGRDSIKHREALMRPRPERERRRIRRTPPPSRREQHEHSIRARDLDPYMGRREREIQDLLPPRRVLSPPHAPTAAAVPYDYYYRQDPALSFMADPRSHGTETRHMLLPHDSHLTADYHHHRRDALSGLYREPPPQSIYHAPPAYAPPPSQSAYGHGQSPLYYRY